MLNPFPVQYLALFAFFLLRVCIGLLALYLGHKILRSGESTPTTKLLGGILVIVGIQFVVGFYTQIAALVGGILTFLGTLSPRLLPQVPRTTLALMWAVSVSLFITGAGVLAFDLPI